MDKADIYLVERLPKAGEEKYLRELYRRSFPPEERRAETEIFSQPTKGLRLYLIYRKAEHTSSNEAQQVVIGFLSLWHLLGFAFIEHFVLDEQYRGRGYGSKCMRHLIDILSPMPIVLECELRNSSSIAERRVRFYEGLGFGLLPYTYAQAPYLSGGDFVPMHLMATRPYDAEAYEVLRQTIYSCVYQLADTSTPIIGR